MNEVTTINLNGRAFQVEKEGYELLKGYLDEAASKLSADPDKDEIISDLEQAFAEKFGQFLNINKTVVTTQEIRGTTAEMGPVEIPKSEETSGSKAQTQESSKRLYRVKEGSVLGGVCTGLAAYFGIDTTLIRLIFVILTLLSHGVWPLIYIVLWIFVPKADTSEKKASAFGAPFTAQQLVDRAKQEYGNFSNRSEWRQFKREAKEKIREQKRQWRIQRETFHGPAWGLASLIIALISIFWLYGLATILTTKAVFGIAIPPNIPLWLSVVAWVLVYSIVVSPFKALKYTVYRGPYGEHYHYHHHGFMESLAWVAVLILIFWLIWQYLPGSHIYFRHIANWWHNFMQNLKA